MQMSVFSSFILILSVVAISSCTKSGNAGVKAKPKQLKSEISFKDKAIDFGTVFEGKMVEASFIFTNKSNVPLILYDVKASCGCTATDWNRNPIRPKAIDTIKVKFDSRHRSGLQKKFITVFSNTKEYVTMLSLEGTVNEKQKTI